MSKPTLITKSLNRDWNGCKVRLEFTNAKPFWLFWKKYDRLDTAKLRLVIQRVEDKIHDDVLQLYEAISEDGIIAEEVLIDEEKVFNKDWKLVAKPLPDRKIPDRAYCVVYNIRGLLADTYTRELAWLGREAKKK